MADASPPRRILLTTDAVGGVWTYSTDLARALSDHGIETVLAVMGPAPEPAMIASAESIPGLRVIATGLVLDWLAEHPEQITATGRELAALAAAQGCDVVQLHSPALAAGADFDRPVVSVHHSCQATWWRTVKGDAPPPPDLLWRMERTARGIAASDAVVTPTTAMAHAVAEVYGLPSPPIVIRNGRAASPIPPDDAGLRAPFVLTSGRLWDDGKNAATLDRAAARLSVPVMAAGAAAQPDGGTAEFPALRMLGKLREDEMRGWLSQAPVFVSAAVYEPFGLGVLEAAQAGCALVLSDIPSFRELWSGACLFAPPHDDEAIAAAISRLFAEPALLRRMSARALQRARHYTPDAMGRQMARLYAGLLALRRVSRGAAA